MKHTLTKGNTPLAASLDDLDNLLNDAQVTLAESHNTSNHGYPFEAMSLRVGDRLQAQPPSKVSTDRFYVRLIGYLQDMSLLITTPVSANGVRLQLIENDQLVMRVFANQSAF
ncbi:MAG: flagellar brake protein, partial [Rhodoferax sp.]|nr:flagellar brake protein [Rhodoferax sp.]